MLTNRTKRREVRDALELLGGELEELRGLSNARIPPCRTTSRRDREADGGKPRQLPPHLAVRQPAQPRHPPGHHREKRSRRHRPGRLPVRRPGHDRSTRGAATYLRAANPRLQTIGIVSTRDDFIPGIRSEAELWRSGCSSATSTPRSCRSGGRCDRSGGGPRPPGWAGRLQRRSRLLGRPAVPAAAAARGRGPAAGRVIAVTGWNPTVLDAAAAPRAVRRDRGVTPRDRGRPWPPPDLRRRAGIARRRCAGPVRRHPREHGVPDRARAGSVNIATNQDMLRQDFPLPSSRRSSDLPDGE